MAGDPFALVGVTLGEHFMVDSFVDEAELSVTYRGHDVRDDTPVAVRCLNLPVTLDLALAGPYIESFQERTRLHRRLAPGHSSFVQVLDSGTTTAPKTDRKVPYEVREWLDAITFATYCAKRRSEGHEGWALADVLSVLDPVAAGLGYVHDVGVTHGEVNPNNLLVVGNRARPAVKIVDFGGAGSASDKHGDAPVLRVLVPEYAAPELVDKQLGAIGPWTDVFSLAVLVLECLAGTLATRNVAASVIVDPKHRPSAKGLGLDLPQGVDEVLERALASEPERRPKNVAAFWRELKKAATASRAPEAVGAPMAASVPPMFPPLFAETSPSAAHAALPPMFPSTSPPMFPSASPPLPAMSSKPPPLPVRPSSPHPPPTNPLVKATLVGLQPTQRLALEKRAPAAEVFSADEAPTRRRDELAHAADGAASARPVTEDPLASMQGAPVGSEAEDPAMFQPALLRPTLVMRARLAFDALGAWWGGRGWPWLKARARDPAPLARVAFGSSVFGGLLVLTLCVKLCVGHGSPEPSVALASATDTPVTTPEPATKAPSAATLPQIPAPPGATVAPAPSAPIEIPDQAPSAAPKPADAPTTPFRRANANKAIEAAGGDLSDCKNLGSLRGTGSVRVSFNKEGGVARIQIGPPYADTPEGACILDRFGRAQMAPFRGPPGSVNYVFNLAK